MDEMKFIDKTQQQQIFSNSPMPPSKQDFRNRSNKEKRAVVHAYSRKAQGKININHQITKYLDLNQDLGQSGLTNQMIYNLPQFAQSV